MRRPLTSCGRDCPGLAGFFLVFFTGMTPVAAGRQYCCRSARNIDSLRRDDPGARSIAGTAARIRPPPALPDSASPHLEGRRAADGNGVRTAHHGESWADQRRRMRPLSVSYTHLRAHETPEHLV